jgi:hypothetical protein
MRSAIAFAGMLLTATPMLLAQGNSGNPAREREVIIRGCVTPAENDTYVMTNVTQTPGAGGATMPEMAHGRRVLFWLKNDAAVKNHPNKMIEVTGRFTDLKESEIEVKSGRQDSGGLVVEIEGPGRDVVASNKAVGAALGTAGRQTPEANDIKTYLAEVRVTHVREVAGSCQ